MDNIYASKSVKIMGITSHTDIERSFTLDIKIPASPGQFVIVSLPRVGEIPIAISKFRADSIDITVRNVGKVTSHLFKKKPGDEIHLRGPYGQGFPLERFKNQRLLIIAGGSGLAAVRPLIANFMQVQANSPHQLKQLDVLVGFKSSKHVLFKADLKRWNKHCDVVITVDTHEDEAESWGGGIGFVVDFVKNVKNIGPDTFAVVTGPPLMMSNSINELLRYQVPEEQIWVSSERHMKCGVGKCGHCRIRDKYVCLNGPVFSYVEAKELID